MDDYAGRVLADRYRLPLPPSDAYELTETRAFDTYSGQEVLLRQVPLPEVVEAEVLDADGLPEGFTARDGVFRRPGGPGETAGPGSPGGRTGWGAPPAHGSRADSGATRQPADPAVRRAVEAAQAAARIPDHPRLDQVFDVFAEGGSLWIASELVAARPLAALLAERPLTPYRAAEVASDILMALRVLHGHGWVHRNITSRTVMVCDDGRVMLTGLAVGAAEEALCGYDPVPAPDDEAGAGGGPADAAGAAPRPAVGPGAEPGPYGGRDGGPGDAVAGGAPAAAAGGEGFGGGAGHGATGREWGRTDAPGGAGGWGARGTGGAGGAGGPGLSGAGGPRGEGGPGTSGVGGAGRPGGSRGFGGPESATDPEAARRAAIEARAAGALPLPGGETESGAGAAGALVRRTPETGDDIRAARAGAIAAYRAGARAAARVQEAQQSPRTALPGARPPAESQGQGTPPGARPPAGNPGVHGALPGARTPGGGAGRGVPPGQIADPYGVRAAPWGGAAPRPEGAEDGRTPAGGPGSGAQGRTALPAAGPEGAPPGASGPARSVFEPPALGPALADRPAGGRPAAHPPAAAPPLGAPYAAGPSAGDLPTGAVAPGAGTPAARWDDRSTGGGGAAVRRGPGTALAAERARQARMTVVGPVTERWAPEQAGPVHANWQLAAPIGPATDLWALGALLFRAVQGHAPYPEESTAELVQMVCAEPPAFAEECGPLRPVVESLLRQDPTDRLDFEELGGWLRSLVRSAPEPEAGAHVVSAPPADPARLPIVRRRGELVRRRRAALPAHHGRHKRAGQETRSPRSLGRLLLLLVLVLLAAAVAYAMLFLPKSDRSGDGGRPGGDRTGAAGRESPAPESSGGSDVSGTPGTGRSTADGGGSPSRSSGAAGTQTTGAGVPGGFTLRKDAAGFRIAVANGWSRTPKTSLGQVVYAHGDFELIVVPGRDSAARFGSDPMVYQRESERELQGYRDSSWATSSGMRTIQVGGKTMAEGQFTWSGAGGRQLFVRNLAVLLDGRYHVVQVRGPESQRDQVSKLYDQASATYRYTG